MQPFDYRIAVQDPLQMALAGYQQGQQFQQQRVQGERETQLYNMEMQQYQAKRAKLQKEQARAQQVQANLAEFFGMVESGTLPAGYVNRFIAENPEIGEQQAAALQGVSEEQKVTGVKDQTRLLMMLNNEPGPASEDSLVAKALKERKAAAEAAGNPGQAAAAESMLMEYMSSPAVLKASLIATLASGAPEAWGRLEPLLAGPELRETIIGGEVVVYDPRDPTGSMQVLGPAPVKAPLIGSINGPGGGPQFGPTPPGTMTIQDPTAPGGYRNVPITGSPLATEAGGAATSKASLNNTFETMFVNYKNLQTAGAIRDVSKGAGANIAAYMQTSPLGREIGKATGAPAEATREAIEALQPSISQAIMAQPGMSAKGMDSEKELQFFIKSITSPTTDVNTNYATLHALDMRFGSGQLLQKMLAQNVITQQEYNKITRSSRVSSVLTQLDDKVDELFTMETPATTAPAVPSRLQKYFGGE